MGRAMKKMSRTAGLVPGTLIHVGQPRTEKVRITVFDYNEAGYKEKEVANVEECFPYKDTSTITWINVDGVHDLEVIEKLGKHFELHPLILEDIANTTQRPELEDFGNYLFIILKMLYRDEKSDDVMVEQVSLVLGPNYVISFQEKEGDVFELIRNRIRNNKGRIRKSGADHLAYSILDAVVDNYFVILENIGEKIEEIEDRLLADPGNRLLEDIHRLKRDMIFLRKSVWPLREVISGLQRGESTLVKKSTMVYLRNVYDHTIQVIDTIEASRDMVSGMVDVYLSSISNKLNEVMKVLTIFAVIFIPLTFIAGVYGMNFKYMPELNWHYGYFLVLGLMAAVAGTMLAYFKRKGWF